MGILNFLFGKKEEKVSEIKKPVRVSCDTSVEDYLEKNIEMREECIKTINDYSEFFKYLMKEDLISEIILLYRERFDEREFLRQKEYLQEYSKENMYRRHNNLIKYMNIKDMFFEIHFEDIDFLESEEGDYFMFLLEDCNIVFEKNGINKLLESYNNDKLIYCIFLLITEKVFTGEKSIGFKITDEEVYFLTSCLSYSDKDEAINCFKEEYDNLSLKVKNYVNFKKNPAFISKYEKEYMKEHRMYIEQKKYEEQKRIEQTARIQIAKRDILEREGYSEDYIRKHMDNIIYNDTEDRDSWSSDNSSSYSSSSDYSSSSSSSSSCSSDSGGGYD